MIQHEDKIKRNVANGLEPDETSSPMNPPKAYDLQKKMDIPYEDLPKALQKLYDDHCQYLEVLDAFEKALIEFRDKRWVINPQVSTAFRDFFEFVDVHASVHNLKEEKALFPLLRKRLIEKGECSPGLNPTTPTDVMEDEHIKVMQLSCLVFNLLGLGAKIPDPLSKNITYQVAMEQGREIVEIMRLHIFKENQVLFPLAVKHLTEEEFAEIWSVIQSYDQSDMSFQV